MIKINLFFISTKKKLKTIFSHMFFTNYVELDRNQ